MPNNFNPIKSVTPVDGSGTATGPAVTDVPCPSVYQWDMEDVSASDAGRTQDNVMHKKMVGQVVAISLSWKNVDNATVAKVLQTFNHEYMKVNYYDAQDGDYKTLEFYVGNRTAPMYSHALGLWSNVSFKIIDRRGQIK